jgi:hypothetical protein
LRPTATPTIKPGNDAGPATTTSYRAIRAGATLPPGQSTDILLDNDTKNIEGNISAAVVASTGE